jgi:NAD(P)-dependent dehydrogenase (short-subunit alcohol dehydrogenase family)
MSGRLQDKVAIVTGAAPQAPGIGNGSAIAMLFAREGAKVLLVNRTAHRAHDLQRTIEQEGGICSVCTADVSHAAEVQQMVDTVLQRYGRLDILVNNVGIDGLGTVETVTEDTWDTLMQVNLKSTMWCCKYSIPQMKSTGGGSIINISTGVAVMGIKRTEGFAAYAASKAGVHGLTLSMAADFAADGIRVNCIVVGRVWTPLVAQLTARYGDTFREQRRLSGPLKTEGTGWDVGWAAVYLASEESRWVTGAFIPVDGGDLIIRERA